MAIHPDVQQFVEFLDSLAKIDPVAMGQLVSHRVPCTPWMAEHPTVQVGVLSQHSKVAPNSNETEHEVGMLGILNGMFGVYDDGPRKGWGPITAIQEMDGSVTGFRLTIIPETEDQSK